MATKKKKKVENKEKMVPHYLFIMKNPDGSHFLAGAYCTIDDFQERLNKRYPKAEIVEAAAWTETEFPVVDIKK